MFMASALRGRATPGRRRACAGTLMQGMQDHQLVSLIKSSNIIDRARCTTRSHFRSSCTCIAPMDSYRRAALQRQAQHVRAFLKPSGNALRRGIRLRCSKFLRLLYDAVRHLATLLDHCSILNELAWEYRNETDEETCHTRSMSLCCSAVITVVVLTFPDEHASSLRRYVHVTKVRERARQKACTQIHVSSLCGRQTQSQTCPRPAWDSAAICAYVH